MTSYLETLLKSQDLRFQDALARADPLYHHATRGARFEELVRSIMQDFLPATYRARDTLLAPGDIYKKQLDLVVHPASIPPLLGQLLPIELITVAGEIKTNLSQTDGICATARELADAAAASPRQHPVPFFVLAGSLENKSHAKTLAGLIASISRDSLSWPLWLAAFSFDQHGPMSAIRVSTSSPIRAETAGGETLDGVVAIPGRQLSPSAVCYLWIWAAIYATDPVHGMDFRYMREEVQWLCAKEGGLDVLFRPADSDDQMSARHLSRLLLPEDQAAYAIHVPAREPVSPAINDTPTVEHAEETERVHGVRKVILITLGTWVDEPDSWDESAWGGSTSATRRGYGYYEAMPEQDLLNSCRLFWNFNPDSDTWRGIKYAVIAYDGRTRAVMRIDGTIGPFWGRYGFRGHLVTDPTLVNELVGREVPRRRNPITTIEL